MVQTGGWTWAWAWAWALLTVWGLAYHILAGAWVLASSLFSRTRMYFPWRLRGLATVGKSWPAPLGQRLTVESNSETQPVGDVMCVAGSQTMCQVLEQWKMGLDDRRDRADIPIPARERDSLPSRDSSGAGTHTHAQVWA